MGMKLIYVAGPYRAPTFQQVDRNIELARRMALRVWRCGAAALCPHLNTAHMDRDGIEDRHILAGDQEMLRRCDAVILCGDHSQSEGSKDEIRLAQQLGLPVFAGVGAIDHLAAWLGGEKKTNGHPAKIAKTMTA